MSEITFWGYVIIFVVGIIIKMIWAYIFIVFSIIGYALYNFLNEFVLDAWNDALNSKYTYLIRFLMILVLGFISMFFFTFISMLFPETEGLLFWRFFPLIDALTS